MSTYYTGQGLSKEQNIIDAAFTDPSEGLEAFTIQRPDGTFMPGTMEDLSILKATYPDFYNTAALSSSMVVGADQQRSDPGGNMSVYLNNGTYDQSRRGWTHFLGTLGMEENTASTFSRSTFSRENQERERASMGGPGGFFPGTPGKLGQDATYWNGLGGGMITQLDLVQNAAGVRLPTGSFIADTLKTATGLDLQRSQDPRIPQLLSKAVEMGYISEDQAEAQGIEALLPLESNNVISRDDASQVGPDVLVEAQTQANAMGLTDPVMRNAWAAQQVQYRIQALATDVLNGRGNPEELAQSFKQMASIFGPDVVQEVMLVTPDYEFNNEKGWSSLPTDYRESLERMGYTQETFLADRADILNAYSYIRNAETLLMRSTAEDMRNRMLETGLHNGWTSMTRRLTDTARVDFWADPAAKYFTAGTLPVGLAFGLASKAGGVGAKTLLANLAAEGMAMGYVEGVVSSQLERLGDFSSGIGTVIPEIDDTVSIQQGLEYGAFGSIGGFGLGGLLEFGLPTVSNQIFRGANGAGSLLNKTVVKVNEMAPGLVPEEAAKVARKMLILNEATYQERTDVQLLADALGEDNAILLRSGELQAIEAARQILPQISDSGRVSTQLETLLSPEALAREGLSALEVSEGLVQIVKAIGPGAKIADDELHSIFSSYMKKAAKSKKALKGLPPKEARLALLDRGLNKLADEKQRNYIPQTERLSDAQAKSLDKKLNSINNRTDLTNEELNQIADLILRSGSRDILDRRLNKLNKGLENRTSAVDFLAEVNQQAEALKTRAVSPELKETLRVESALEGIRPEKTINIAKGLGTSPTRLLKYAREVEKAVARGEDVAQLKLDFPVEAAAVKAINERGTGAFEFNESVDSFYDFKDFVAGGGLKKIKAYRAALKAAAAANEEGVDATVRAKTRKALQKAAKDVGIDLAQKEALEKTLKIAKQVKDYHKLSGTAKAEAQLHLVKNLDGIRAGDISPGSADVDTKFLETTLEGTSLGAWFGKQYARMTVWGHQQSKLYRDNNRIIRGMTQFISGQHMAKRTFNSQGQVLAVDSITAGAQREALPYISASMNMRRRMPGKLYAQFDQEMIRLRLQGKFLDQQIDANQLNGDLRSWYSSNGRGGDEALLKDLRAINDAFTDLNTRVINEAEDAGMKFGTLDPRTYYPNHLSEEMSIEGAQKFAEAFSGIMQEKLLRDEAELSDDILAGLGWIEITAKGELTSLGDKTPDTFTVPKSSPFWNKDLSQEEMVEQVKKIMTGGVTALDSLEGTVSPTAGSRRKTAGQLINKPVDIVAIKRGEELLGNTMNSPVPESAVSNGESSAAAQAITGTDPILRDLEAARNNLALLDDPALDGLKDRFDAAISLRQRALDAVTRERFANDRAATVSRVEIPVEEQEKLIMSDTNYSNLSAGHSSLVQRLDEMLANGMIDEDAKRIVMAAFVDVDPSKLAGMSFTRLDINQGLRLQGQVAVGKDLDPSGALIKIGDVSDEVTNRTSKDVAETIVHETAHAAFLSASPRLQKTLQALFNQARSGDNDIVDLFRTYDIPVDRALENVHEFVAYLAQISLISDKIKVENPTTRTMLTKMKEYFISLCKGIFLQKEARLGESIMPGKFDAVEKGIKNIFDTLEDDNLTDNLRKKFNLETEDVRVDDFGDETTGIADSRRKDMKASEDVTAEDIIQAQNRLAEKFFAENKGPIALESFTNVLMDRLFREGWPTDDKGKLLSDDALYAIATGKEFNAVKRNIMGRGPGGDKKGKKASSMSAGERDLEFDSLDPEFQVDSAREELLTLVDAGLRSSAADARRAAKVIQDSVKMAQAFERRGLQQGERGAYILTDEQAADIAEEIGMSKSKVLRHNYKNGLLNAQNLSKQSDIVSGAVTDEARLASATRVSEDIEIEMEEAVQSLPSVQESIAATSVGQTDAPFPGYTRFTSDELMDIAQDSDNVFTFLSRTVQAEVDGPGVSYNGELADFYNTVRRTVEPEAPEPEVTVRVEEPEAEAPARVEEPEAEAPARVEDAGGEEPPAPPKAPASATPEEDPFKRIVREQIASPKKGKRLTMNKNYWQSDKSLSLKQIYQKAVTGEDNSLISPSWKDTMKEQTIYNDGESILDYIARQYTARNRSGMKVGIDANTNKTSAQSQLVEQLAGANITRVFKDEDFRNEAFGDQLADLFSRNTASADAANQMAKGNLGAIRIQKTINDSSGMEGMSIVDLFDGVRSALTTQAQRNLENGGVTKSLGAGNESVSKEIDDYMTQLQKLFILARGGSLRSDDANQVLGKGSRIARNLAYSVMGAKFALSVLYSEGLIAPLRAGGLDPIKKIKSLGIFWGNLAKHAYKGVLGNSPMQKYMAKFGFNEEMMRYTLEDLSHNLDNVTGSRLSKFVTDDGDGTNGILSLSTGDKTRKTFGRLKTAGQQLMKGNVLDSVEEFTGTMSELTAMASFMAPVVDSVKSVAANEAKTLLLRHLPALIAVAKEVNEAGIEGMTTKAIIAAGRKHGLPRPVVMYAAQSGLLSRNGKLLESFQKYLPAGTKVGRKPSAGRVVDLNDLSEKAYAADKAARSGFLGTEFTEGLQEVIDVEREMVPALQQFIEHYMLEFSPELRGADRMTGDHPLKELLFAITTYPIAAYNRLVKNGGVARGPAFVTALMTTLVFTEYLNRNLQKIVEGDEEQRAEAIENLTSFDDPNQLLEVLATQGLASPIFGQAAPYFRDVLGPMVLKLGDSDETLFRHSPFSGPAIGTLTRAYNATVGQAGMAAKALAGDGMQDKDWSRLAKSIAFVSDAATPFNSMIPRIYSEQTYGMTLSEKMAAALTGQEQAQKVLAPSSSYPTYDKSFMSAFTAASSPSSPSQVAPATPRVDELAVIRQQREAEAAPAAPAPAPAPAPKTQTPKSSFGPGSAGSSLADLFNK